jgi:hypothetical protein
MKEADSTLYAEVRECKECGKMWECLGNPETTALRNKIQRHADDLALHCEQYNAGVDAAKTGKVCGPRPEFDTSTYYDGYAATMLPVLRERIAELEAALKVYADYDNWSAEYPRSRLRLWRGEHAGPDVAEEVLEGGK